MHHVLEVGISEVFNFIATRDRKLPDKRQFYFLITEFYVEIFTQRRLHINQWKSQHTFVPRLENIKHVINAVIIWEDKILLVNLHHSFEVDAVMEEFHKWFYVRSMGSLEANSSPPNESFVCA